MVSEKLQRLQDGDKALVTELVRDHHRVLIALAAAIVGQAEADAGFTGRHSLYAWQSR